MESERLTDDEFVIRLIDFIVNHYDYPPIYGDDARRANFLLRYFNDDVLMTAVAIMRIVGHYTKSEAKSKLEELENTFFDFKPRRSFIARIINLNKALNEKADSTIYLMCQRVFAACVDYYYRNPNRPLLVDLYYQNLSE